MSETEHPNLTLMREGFDAMAKGDIQWMSDHLADDVVWHVGGNSKMAGEYHGKEQVLAMFPPQSDDDTSGIDIHDVLANDEHGVSIGTARFQAPDGDRIEYRFVNVFHLEGGKLKEAWGMAENDAVTDPFFDKLAPS
jgi:ketosteroid isomerase-like protein